MQITSVMIDCRDADRDRLDITTAVVSVGRVRSVSRQGARRDADLVASIDITCAFTGPDGCPIQPPDGFMDTIAEHVV